MGTQWSPGGAPMLRGPSRWDHSPATTFHTMIIIHTHNAYANGEGLSGATWSTVIMIHKVPGGLIVHLEV
jgi:hypothetical protein